MTPGIEVLRDQNVAHQVHEYEHDPRSTQYGIEAAEKLNVSPERVFKTLVLQLSTGKLGVAVIPVSAQLNMKLAAKALQEKKCTMADPTVVERATGCVPGGVSPLGQKRQLKTIIDETAIEHGSILVSAGRRGLEIEIKPTDLAKLLNAEFTTIINR